MRALVTGVAGFVGSNLARQLLREGHEVVGIDVHIGSQLTELAPYEAAFGKVDFAS